MATVLLVFSQRLEISDALLSLSGQTAEDFVEGLINDAADTLPDFLSEAEITVTVDDGDAEYLPEAPQRPAADGHASGKAVKPAKTAAPAVRAPQPKPVSQPRTAAPVDSSEADDSKPTRRGRPPRLVSEDGSEWEASDGGPVTEWGPRSVPELKDEGVACRKVGAAAWPKWYQRLLLDDDTETEEAAPQPRAVGRNAKDLPKVQVAAASAPAPTMRRRAGQ